MRIASMAILTLPADRIAFPARNRQKAFQADRNRPSHFCSDGDRNAGRFGRRAAHRDSTTHPRHRKTRKTDRLALGSASLSIVQCIVGVWKVVAVAALLWPRLPRSKEWWRTRQGTAHRRNPIAEFELWSVCGRLPRKSFRIPVTTESHRRRLNPYANTKYTPTSLGFHASDFDADSAFRIMKCIMSGAPVSL